MEIVNEQGELCAWCSDDPLVFINIQPVEAIRLLTLKYIEQCGASLGMRTLYYSAAEAWQEILAGERDNPMAIPAKDLPLYQFMPLICEEYKPELYDDYDIANLTDDELLALYEKALKDCDEETAEALELLDFNIRLSKYYNSDEK